MYGPRYAAGSPCASNEEKIKQREDKVFVVISEKFSLFWSVYI